MDLIKNSTLDKKIEKLNLCKNVLLIGPKNSGKTFTCIKYLSSNASNEKTLFFTSDSKKEVEEQFGIYDTSSVNYLKNNIRILEAPKQNGTIEAIADDKYLTRIILGIINQIADTRPDKIVFDELTHFLSFQDLDFLKKVIRKLHQYLDHYNVRSVFSISEPVSNRAKLISDIVKNEFSFHIHMTKNPIVLNK